MRLVIARCSVDYDGRLTAQHAMRILVGAIRREIRPITTHRKLRMLTSAERQNLTIDGAYRRLIAISREMERRPGVLAVSIFTTQPWMDLPEMGFTTVVVADSAAAADAAAERITRAAWEARQAFQPVVMAPAAAMNDSGLKCPASTTTGSVSALSERTSTLMPAM